MTAIPDATVEDQLRFGAASAATALADAAQAGLGSARLPELDGVRGIAIGMVLLFHYFVIQVNAPMRSLASYALAPFRMTWSGVDLFFVLSGFLIGGILLDARTSSNYFRVFYTRRFFRIVPVYAVLVAATLLIAAAVRGDDASWLLKDELPWVPYVLFVQNFWMAHAATLGMPLLVVTWSLAVEEQFYLTLPLVVRLVRPRTLVALLLAGALLAPALRFALYMRWPANTVARQTLMPCRADALLLGVLGAMFLRDDRCREWLKGHQRSFRFLFAVLAVGMAVLTKYSGDFQNGSGALVATAGYTWLALFYLCLILSVLTWREGILSRVTRFRWLGSLGSIAYGVYLFHYVFLYVAFAVIRFRPPQIHSAVDFGISLATLAATMGTCWASWTFFEKPLVKLGHREHYHFDEAARPLRVSTARVVRN